MRTTTTVAPSAVTRGRRDWNDAHRGQNPFPPVPTTRGPSVARCRRWRRLRTFGPMNPSMAGRSVSAASIVNATPIDAESEHPEQGDADDDAGEEHGPPGGVDGPDDGRLDVPPGDEALPVARDDE